MLLEETQRSQDSCLTVISARITETHADISFKLKRLYFVTYKVFAFLTLADNSA